MSDQFDYPLETGSITLLAGITGCGKTVTCKTLASRLADDAIDHVVVIDERGIYYDFFAEVGGKTVSSAADLDAVEGHTHVDLSPLGLEDDAADTMSTAVSRLAHLTPDDQNVLLVVDEAEWLTRHPDFDDEFVDTLRDTFESTVLVSQSPDDFSDLDTVDVSGRDGAILHWLENNRDTLRTMFDLTDDQLDAVENANHIDSFEVLYNAPAADSWDFTTIDLTDDERTQFTS